jgi:pimeloyl-CoA synthetase
MPATLGFIMNGGKALTLEVSISTDGEEDTDDEAQKTLSEQGVDKDMVDAAATAIPEKG